MVALEWPNGLRSDDAEPLRLADRGSPPNAIEAPYLVEHDGDYFLFVSCDCCCQGADSTYNDRRSAERMTSTGPYVDRDGVPLLDDGGTVLLETDGARVGPGGQSVADGMLALHYYDGDLNGRSGSRWCRSAGTADGWPELHW